MGELEDSSSGNSSDKFQHGVDEGLEEKTSIEDVGRGNAERHGRVQGATRDATDGEATHRHARANDQTEEVRGLGALGHRNREHHIGEDEGEDDLRHGDGGPCAGAHRPQAEGPSLVDEGVGQRRSDASRNLNSCIRSGLGGRQLGAAAGGKDCDGDGRVEVGAGDIAQGIDHGGEASGNGEGGCLGAAKDVEAHSQNQHVGAQELAHQLGCLALLTTEIFRAHHLEEGSGHGGAKQLEDHVGDGPTEATPCTGHIDAQSHSRVEAATGDGPCTIGASHHGEGDGHAIVLVLLPHILLGSSDIHDHEGQHEGVEELAETSVVPGEALGRGQVETLPEEQRVANGGRDACSGLHTSIDADCLPVQARATHGTRDAQRHRHSRVEVGARDATQRVDAHHQHEGNGHSSPGG
mmetsp:Transcript_44355/g.103655  ORF Transcript_44355/g.103655 Transcript_44355/m.103655 type:complete len:409 (+) Transcript_44355:218-1444(+)